MFMSPQTIGTIHFVGIGGIGMSGIAEILVAQGFDVQGSDIAEGANVVRMRDKGVRVMIGHDGKNVFNAEGKPVHVVVISSAIQDDNPELLEARAQKIVIVRRADMLAELMRTKRAVAVAGTHGKTTTTSLVACMLEQAGLDPTVINGGIVNAYGTNTRQGAGDWMVVEADESDGSFSRLPATAAIVTNIDPEHLDYYGSYDAIKLAFKNFVSSLPFYGFAVMCADHPAIQAMLPELEHRKVVTYGLNPQADFRAENLRPSIDGVTFDVSVQRHLTGNQEPLMLRDVFLPMLGEHNVLNALSALATGHMLNVEPSVLVHSLRAFSGVKRRFTKTGEVRGVKIFDDYGHHPTEIAAVLKAARSSISTQAESGKIIAIVQPHRYTRLQSLFDDFCTCMNDADCVVVLDVYAAGETKIEGFEASDLAEGLSANRHQDASYLEDHQKLAHYLIQDKNLSEGDVVIFLGAGDITKMAAALPAQLDDVFSAENMEQKRA